MLVVSKLIIIHPIQPNERAPCWEFLKILYKLFEHVDTTGNL